MNELGGEITRLDFDDVEKEITDAKDVEKETKDSAEKSWKNKKQDTNETSESK